MNTLPPLPDLNQNNYVTPPVTGGVGKIVSDAAANVVTGGVYGAIKAANPKFSIQSIVVIVVGLLFIAAGIFAFKEVRQTVITTGKTAAKVAMV